MSSLLVTFLTFAAVALLVGGVISVVSDAFLRYRALMKERLAALSGRAPTDGLTALFDLKQTDEHAANTRTDWRARYHVIVEQAGMHISASTLAGWSATSGAVLAIFFAAFSRTWWLAAPALVVGLTIPSFYVLIRRRRRMRRLCAQLPLAFDTIGRAVRAGQTVPAAFQIVADEFESPIAEEFRRCYEQQNLGVSHETVLRELARRTGLMELRILVVALLVQSRSGGNLVELLGNLSAMVRERLKLQQKVRALTGEGRMQAAVLIVLPVLAFGIMTIIAPEYIGSLLERPRLLACTASAQVLGAVWIQRIISFDF
jgi:tight adherence protein B